MNRKYFAIHKMQLFVIVVFLLSLILTGKGLIADKNSGFGGEIVELSGSNGVFDRSFCESCWNGIKQFKSETGDAHTIKYFTPEDMSESTLTNLLRLAVKGKGKVIFASTFDYAPYVAKIETEFPDSIFVQVDSVPCDADFNPVLNKNTIAITFAEEESGFLAGYSAVMDGYRKLGFAGGMPFPSVRTFGYGFIYGAEQAAKELGLAKDEVEIKYTYLGTFSATPEVLALATAWYNGGTDCIFAAAGAANGPVIKAAEQTGKKTIGVDSDMYMESPTVITSALKNVNYATNDILHSIYDGSFEGGKIYRYTASENGVGLPMEHSRFNKFTVEQYNAIFERLKNNEFKLNVDYSDAGSIEVDKIKVLVY